MSKRLACRSHNRMCLYLKKLLTRKVSSDVPLLTETNRAPLQQVSDQSTPTLGERHEDSRVTSMPDETLAADQSTHVLDADVLCLESDQRVNLQNVDLALEKVLSLVVEEGSNDEAHLFSQSWYYFIDGCSKRKGCLNSLTSWWYQKQSRPALLELVRDIPLSAHCGLVLLPTESQVALSVAGTLQGDQANPINTDTNHWYLYITENQGAWYDTLLFWIISVRLSKMSFQYWECRGCSTRW